MSSQHFDAPTELKKLREKNNIRRRKIFHLSQLTRCRAELVALRKNGASFRELVFWLKEKKRIKVTHTTIMRYLNQLPELKETTNAEFSQR